MPSQLIDRRSTLAALGALVFRLLGGRAGAQAIDVTEADLERESAGRVIRIGNPSSGGVTTFPLEVYVARVLSGEADPRAADASREALAIAIRTYTLANEGRHARDGYDLCDTTHCQVLRSSSESTRRLTMNTVQQVLTYDGTPATLYYSASCGGYSERASDVWAGVDLPYLQARPDPVHDDEVPWALELSLAEADAALKRLGFEGQLLSLTVDARSASGRAATLRAWGMDPSNIGGDQFRLAVGATRIRSTAFSLVPDGQTLRFTGRGYGHGVGLCVVGAAKRAARGESAAEILTQYFPGLDLVRISPAGPGTAVPGAIVRATTTPPADPTTPAAPSRTVPRPQPFPRPR